MNGINRRHFLVAAGATLAPAVMRGAPTKIRTGVLCIQHSHTAGKLKAIRENPNYELVAACEPNEAIRAEKGGSPLLKDVKWVSFDDLLADKSIDLIIFEGEVKDAIPFSKRILEAGKHIHLEKPPTNKLEPFREVINIARQRERRLQLGYLWRFHPGTDLAMDIYKNGWLGDVYMIRATINSDRDATQRAIEGRFRGGGMFELGGHVIDRIVAFWGRPDAVKPLLRHDTSMKDAVNDNALAVFEYPKSLAVVIAQNRDAFSHRSFEITGTDGSILIDPLEPNSNVRIQLRNAQGPYQKGTQEVKFGPQPRFVKDFEELARSIKTGTPLKYSYEHELTLHETLLRASGEIA